MLSVGYLAYKIPSYQSTNIRTKHTYTFKHARRLWWWWYIRRYMWESTHLPYTTITTPPPQDFRMWTPNNLLRRKSKLSYQVIPYCQRIKTSKFIGNNISHTVLLNRGISQNESNLVSSIKSNRECNISEI